MSLIIILREFITMQGIAKGQGSEVNERLTYPTVINNGIIPPC